MESFTNIDKYENVLDLSWFDINAKLVSDAKK